MVFSFLLIFVEYRCIYFQKRAYDRPLMTNEGRFYFLCYCFYFVDIWSWVYPKKNLRLNKECLFFLVPFLCKIQNNFCYYRRCCNIEESKAIRMLLNPWICGVCQISWHPIAWNNIELYIRSLSSTFFYLLSRSSHILIVTLKESSPSIFPTELVSIWH